MERYLVELDGDQVELLSGMVREAIKVADEKNVAKKSRSIVDRMSGARKTKRRPSSAAAMLKFPRSAAAA